MDIDQESIYYRLGSYEKDSEIPLLDNEIQAFREDKKLISLRWEGYVGGIMDEVTEEYHTK